ncbi:MAG TPA: hypothetical protein VMV79_02670 [Alphaproteobacteria bacterium]|nr:hypothetical protein [Alphaproteobacteria bacterium]
MSVSAIGSAASAVNTSVLTAQLSAKPGSDGDPASVEATETSATKIAENARGGFAPKPTSAVSATTAPTGTSTGGVNKLV